MAATQFTPEESLSFRRALGKLRYGGLVAPSGVENVDDLLSFLDAFGKVLVSVSDRASDQELELNQLKSDVAAFRRVLGVVPAKD